MGTPRAHIVGVRAFASLWLPVGLAGLVGLVGCAPQATPSEEPPPERDALDPASGRQSAAEQTAVEIRGEGGELARVGDARGRLPLGDLRSLLQRIITTCEEIPEPV